MSTATPTIFLVDDDPSVLRGLSRLLRSAGWSIATFQSSEDFINRFDSAVPGCLILDISMPGLNGLELQRWLADQKCSLPIIFLTGQGNISTSVRAMKAGAIDFLTKPVGEDDLFKAIQQAVTQDRVSRQERAERLALEERLRSLTPREREVLERVVSGKLNKEIALELGTVEKTIKVHRARVMDKMGADSLAALVRLTGRIGIRLP